MIRPRADHNQRDIIEALRKIGATVVSLTGVGRGVPDLMVGYRGSTWLLEVKQPGGKRSQRQMEWAASWRGGYVGVVSTPQEAIGCLTR